MNRFVVISGCSNGGKSTLLAALGRRGYAVVDEPGRRIVKDELAGDGLTLPWVDETALLRRAIAMALADRASAIASDGWVFFDRGLIDAAAGLQHLTGEPLLRDSVNRTVTIGEYFWRHPGPRSTCKTRSAVTVSIRRLASIRAFSKFTRLWVTKSRSCRRPAWCNVLILSWVC